MLLWQMSDRTIPRSYRMMQGFGVHTFRLINEAGQSQFVKYHWNPKAGTHSLDWDEAVKINGADPDFHRRDLWDAIESGAYPEWELCVQLFSEEQAEGFSFDVLDATKIIPEELVPLRPVGRLVLNRNPENFFAETEQVAFCTQHIVPGMDFTNDPLLTGRNHSYLDTQLTRLGGPNFHEIPINQSRVQVHNNQRDGFHRQAIPRGRVAYEPNSLAGGCPFQAGMAQGFMTFPERIAGDQVRGKPEKFAEHFNQARLFWLSQSPIEQMHIVRAFSFELAKVHTGAIRQRVVSMLRNVDDTLAGAVATNLGFELPPAQPRALERAPKPEVERSAALSLFSRPGDGDISGRRVAILITDGVEFDAVDQVREALLEAGAVVQLVASRLGEIACNSANSSGKSGGKNAGESGNTRACRAEATLLSAPSVVFDAVIIPDGGAPVESPAIQGAYGDFVRDAYRHAKPMLVMGRSGVIMAWAKLEHLLAATAEDPGLISSGPDGDASSAAAAFQAAIAKHRHFARWPEAGSLF
jgi:catalase